MLGKLRSRPDASVRVQLQLRKQAFSFPSPKLMLKMWLALIIRVELFIDLLILDYFISSINWFIHS